MELEEQMKEHRTIAQTESRNHSSSRRTPPDGVNTWHKLFNNEVNDNDSDVESVTDDEHLVTTVSESDSGFD